MRFFFSRHPRMCTSGGLFIVSYELPNRQKTLHRPVCTQGSTPPRTPQGPLEQKQQRAEKHLQRLPCRRMDKPSRTLTSEEMPSSREALVRGCGERREERGEKREERRNCCEMHEAGDFNRVSPVYSGRFAPSLTSLRFRTTQKKKKHLLYRRCVPSETMLWLFAEPSCCSGRTLRVSCHETLCKLRTCIPQHFLRIMIAAILVDRSCTPVRCVEYLNEDRPACVNYHSFMKGNIEVFRCCRKAARM